MKIAELNKLKLELANLVSLSPTKIILFGSQAQGTQNENSDIDLVIVKKTVNSKIKEANEARRALRSMRMPIDAIVVSEEEFDFYKNCPNSVFCEADKKGVVLYVG